MKPLLCLDVDGVVNLVDIDPSELPPGVRFELIDGVPYVIAAGARDCLKQLQEITDPVWATGWGGRANELLAPALGLGFLPEVRFEQTGGRRNAFWKVEAIGEYAGTRPVAWLDDSFDDRCRQWERDRNQAGLPTLLVPIDPAFGLTESAFVSVREWTEALREKPGKKS